MIQGLHLFEDFCPADMAEGLAQIVMDDWEKAPRPGAAGIKHVMGFFPQEGGLFARPALVDALLGAVYPFMGDPTSLIASFYGAGAQLPYHVDPLRWDNTICVFNAMGSAYLSFVHPHTGEQQDLLTTPGSLTVMGGDARRTWLHGISSIPEDRIVFVARAETRN